MKIIWKIQKHDASVKHAWKHLPSSPCLSRTVSSSQLRIGTKKQIEKLAMGSIKNAVSEVNKGCEDFHMMASQWVPQKHLTTKFAGFQVKCGSNQRHFTEKMEVFPKVLSPPVPKRWTPK